MSNIETLTEDTFDVAISQSSDIVLVDFGASWCTPCRALQPVLESLSKEVPNKIYKIDIDDCPNLTKRFSIRSVPTVSYFQNGKVIAQKVGLVNKEALLKLLQ